MCTTSEQLLAAPAGLAPEERATFDAVPLGPYHSLLSGHAATGLETSPGDIYALSSVLAATDPFVITLLCIGNDADFFVRLADLGARVILDESVSVAAVEKTRSLAARRGVGYRVSWAGASQPHDELRPGGVLVRWAQANDHPGSLIDSAVANCGSRLWYFWRGDFGRMQSIVGAFGLAARQHSLVMDLHVDEDVAIIAIGPRAQ